MRITSKGQVTIPQAIRERTGLLPNPDVEFKYEKGQVILRRAAKSPTRGRQAVTALRNLGRRQCKSPFARLTTEETLLSPWRGVGGWG